MAQIRFWIDTVQPTASDQSAQQSSTLASMIVAEEYVEHIDDMTLIYSPQHWWDIPEEVIMHSGNIMVYVGLDVHKETLAVAIAVPERLGEVRYYGMINNEAQAVRRLFQRLQELYGNILSCHEAGPCGLRLHYQLTAMSIKCQVIAPSRIPKSSTDRIKDDHRDAISLVRLLRVGELTLVRIPDLTHEAMRDLIRVRAAAKRDSRVARQRIPSMLL